MDRYEVIRELGHGGVASVFLCREVASGRFVAVKRIPLHRIQSPEQKRRAEAERFVLAHAPQSPFLCHGHGSFKADDTLALVMEYIEDARPLYQCIWRYQSTGAFPERVAKYFTVQIVLAVEEMHRLGYIHRDLKSGNVLVDKHSVVRVIDYGFAKRIGDQDEAGDHRTYSICGTHYIMAPEMYLHQPYAESVDWWAVGVIVHEMVCGRPPWDYQPATSHAAATFFDKITDVAKRCSVGGDVSVELGAADVSDECRSFIKELLVFNPRKRLGSIDGAAAVKAHQWFNGVDWVAASTPPIISLYDPVKDFRNDDHAAPQAIVGSSSSAESIDPEENAKYFADF